MNRKQLETKLREQERALANLNDIIAADKKVTSFEERTDKTRTHLKRGETTLTKAELEEKRNKMEMEKEKIEATINDLRQQVDRKLVVELTRIDQQNRWKVARRKTTTPTYTEFPDVFSDSDENRLIIDDKPKRKRKRTKKGRNKNKPEARTRSPSETVTNETPPQAEKSEETEQTVEIIPQMKLPLKKRKIGGNQAENTSVVVITDDEADKPDSEGNQEQTQEHNNSGETEPTHTEKTKATEEAGIDKPFEIVKKKGEEDKNIITIRMKKRKVKQIRIKTEKTESPPPLGNQEDSETTNPTSEVGYIEIKPTTPPRTTEDITSPENTEPHSEDQEVEEANPPPTISPAPREVTNAPTQQTSETSENPQRISTTTTPLWRPHEIHRPTTTWTPNPTQTTNIHNQIEAIRRRQQAQLQQTQRPNTLAIPNIPTTQPNPVTTPMNPPQNHPPQMNTAAEYILNNIQNPISVATSQTRTGRPRGRPPTRDIRPTNTTMAAVRPQPIQAGQSGQIVAAGRPIPITHHHETGNPSQANFVTHNPVARMQNQRSQAIQRLINNQRTNNMPTPRPYNLHHGNHRLPFNNNMQIGDPLQSTAYPTNDPPRSLPTQMSPSIFSRQTLPVPPIFLPANTYWIIRATRAGTHNDMTQVFLWPLYGYNAFENPLATTGTRNATQFGYPARVNQ